MHTARRAHQRTPAPRRQQRGFAAVYAGIALIAMLTALGLAIDVGNLYFAQRNLQRLATLAAIDASRVISGCNGADTVPSASEVTAAVTDSLARNGASAEALYTAGSTVNLGGYRRDANGLYVFEPLPAADPRLSAVQVNLKAAPPARYIQMPGQTTSAGTLQASAAATQYPIGSFQIGSTLADVSTAQSTLLNPLLSGLLGATVSLSPLNYEALAGVQLTIANIGTAVGIDVNSNLQELLNTTVSLPGALNALATAVNLAAGGVSTTAGALISQLAALADPGRTTTWGAILGIEPLVETVVTQVPVVDALSLILALGQSADQGTPLALPINASIPKLLALNTFVTVAKGLKPSSGVGRAGYADPGSNTQPYTAAYQSEVALGTRLKLDASALGTGATINLGLDVAVAPGSAALAAIECPLPTRTTPIATINARTAGGHVTIGTYAGSGSSYPPLTGGTLAKLQVLGIGLLTINIKSPSGISQDILGNNSDTIIYSDFTPDTSRTSPPPIYQASLNANNPVSFGSDQLLSTTTALVADLVDCDYVSVMLLGADVCSVPLVAPTLSLLGRLLASVVGPLVDTVVDPLLQLLGIQIGTLTVQMNNVSVGNPAVFSRAVPGSTP